MTDSAWKVALVTGAGSGLGRAFVVALAEAGFRVVAAGRDQAKLRETLRGLPDDRAMSVLMDVTDAAGVDTAMDQVVDRWGRIDVLVNNAGIFGPTGPLDELDLDAFQATIQTNVMGYVNCARSATRIMRAQDPRGGRIINNGSISAHVPRPLSSAYTVSKHAITGLTRSLALDGRADGIACGQIDIGNASTAITGPLTNDSLQADGTRGPEPSFHVADAARGVAYMATLPPEANVLFLTVTATNMPFVGRG